ncbi:MAG TPA: ABC transporter permease subunit [Vicinamibacterales bacterium]|nr:ABC transporter permease subunit [Vicinamibacterales bacterium]
MRSAVAFRWLLRKEWRELLASRAWWVLLLAMGPLVGVTFISAVRTYAEASGLNGTAVGVGEAFSPLIGIWAPTFSACEVAAVFLLPFVAIRLVSGDRQSGALKIEAQHPISPLARIGAKALVLAAAWIIASIPGAIAIALWRSYGGSIHPPEVATVLFGHLLNAGLTIALAALTAAVTEHPSTAAILTLTATVGTWILNFVAAVQGGVWERIAGYTPPAMIATFQHGLVRLDVVLVAALLIAAGIVLAAVWIRTGVPIRRRVRDTVAWSAAAAAAIFACAFVTPSWDSSESRVNSLPEPDERVLAALREPLSVEAHLAPEDPRRADLERKALSKLRRVLPHTQVRYISSTSIGLFEQTRPHYGEIWYELGGRREMSRATTAEGMLEAIYDLAGIKPPVESDDAVFRGHPLAVPPKGAATIFYAIWPAVVVASAFFARRKSP